MSTAWCCPGSGRQTVQALLPTVRQVRLDHLGKEVPLQQAVGERQQLGHGLVEVLQERTAALSTALRQAHLSPGLGTSIWSCSRNSSVPSVADSMR